MLKSTQDNIILHFKSILFPMYRVLSVHRVHSMYRVRFVSILFTLCFPGIVVIAYTVCVLGTVYPVPCSVYGVPWDW